MPNVFNRLSKKFKDKIVQRNYEKDSKYIIDSDLGPIDSVFRNHLGICDGTYTEEVEDEDDTRSVSSFSTMATMDGNPGAGCTVDKYFYQPVGRRIEKIAFQIAMPFLPPGRVVQYIEESLFKGHLYFNHTPLSIIELNTVYLTGLNSLLHQTQSTSVIRSSAALSALSRLCPIDYFIHSFYYNFRLRTRNANLVVLSVDNDNLEKKCYLFLEALSRVQSTVWMFNPVYNLRDDTPLLLKGELLRLVQSWRTSDNDAFAIIPEVCLQFTSAKDHCQFYRGVEEYEMLYFFILFILRFPPFIYYKPTHYKCKQRAQQLHHMMLTTLLRWLDSVLYSYLSECKALDSRAWQKPTGSELEKRLAIYGLLRYQPLITTLLPATSRHLCKEEPFEIKFLPRSLRRSGRHWTVIHNLIEGSSARTQRLLKSIDELEREIWDSMTITKSEDKHFKEDMLMSYNKLRYTRNQAQSVNVLDSDTNEEFLKARQYEDDWDRYKRYCRIRHTLGTYLRSNLDWDPDTTSCLVHLFELPDEPVSSAAHIATVNLDVGGADTWNISTEATLPKMMKVSYKSATGETKYKTIMFCPSSDDVASSGELAQVDREQGEVSVILPEPRYGGGEEAEREPGGIAPENNDSAATQTAVELGATDNRFCSDDSDSEEATEATEETSKTIKVVHEQQVDQISICSLD